jgi:hypothetical protein
VQFELELTGLPDLPGTIQRSQRKFSKFRNLNFGDTCQSLRMLNYMPNLVSEHWHMFSNGQIQIEWIYSLAFYKWDGYNFLKIYIIFLIYIYIYNLLEGHMLPSDWV